MLFRQRINAEQMEELRRQDARKALEKECRVLRRQFVALESEHRLLREDFELQCRRIDQLLQSYAMQTEEGGSACKVQPLIAQKPATGEKVKLPATPTEDSGGWVEL